MQNPASLRMLQYIQQKSSPKYPVFLLDRFFDEYRKDTGTARKKSEKVLGELLEEGYISLVYPSLEGVGEPIGFSLSALGSSYDEFMRVEGYAMRARAVRAVCALAAAVLVITLVTLVLW